MATHGRDLLTAADSVNSSSSCSSSPLNPAETTSEKEIRESSSPPSVISSTTYNNNTLNKITASTTFNNSPIRRFDGGEDDTSRLWEDDKEGRFRVTMVNRKRKPVFIDFFLNDAIKTISAAAHQQPPPEEEYSDELSSTQLGLGWGPYIPTKKTTKRGVDQDPDDDLELRIGPPIPKRSRRVFPDNGYWEIKKRLTKSDVNGSSRLLLPRKLVEDHVLVRFSNMQVAAITMNEAGLEIGVFDVDTETHHRLVMKLWPSSCCYVLTKNWTCDFVKRRGLAENQEIGLRWNGKHSRLEFTAFN